MSYSSTSAPASLLQCMDEDGEICLMKFWHYRKRRIETTITKEEMAIRTIIIVLDSKQKSHSSMVQSNATFLTIALAGTNGVYDDQHTLWKRYNHNNNMIEKKMLEIQDLESKLERHICNKKMKGMEIEIPIDCDPSPRLFETPRSSLSSMTMLLDDSSNDEENEQEEHDDTVNEAQSK